MVIPNKFYVPSDRIWGNQLRVLRVPDDSSRSEIFELIVPVEPLCLLLDGRSGDRIPAEARISAPVQTGPGVHPASYTMGTGSFPEVKRPGRGVDNPHHLAMRLKKE